jgi:biopolymer transport protein TolR
MAMAGKSGGGAISEINVTPLVDVMLVLLIIFMVTATIIRNQEESERVVDMDLPVTRENPTVIDIAHTDKLILKIDANLRVYVTSPGTDAPDVLITDCSASLTQTNPDRFEPCFQQIFASLGQNARLMSERELYILGEPTIPYGFVVGTLNQIRLAGVDKVGMVTNPEYLRTTPAGSPTP